MLRSSRESAEGKSVEREIRNVFLPAWSSKPVDEISDLDVLAIINTKKRTAPAQARNLLATAKRLFNWAIDQRVYGLNFSPCDRLKPTAIIGEKIHRQHQLNDDELSAFLRVVRRLPYPYGPVYQLLVLTGLRLREVADAQWSEIHNDVWTIPAGRMKGKNSKAQSHVVPLTPDMLAIIESLPRFTQGPYIFSTTFLHYFRQKADASMAGINVQDAAVLFSIARQYGAPLDVLRKSLMRDSKGDPSGPLAAALDFIAQRETPNRD